MKGGKMTNFDDSNLILRSFDPIADSESKVLILGTMPGAESLRKRQYYAHPRNLFWPLIYGIFDENPDADYNKKIDFLRSKKIALWDVYKSCRRKGSLDSNICDEIPNDVAGLLNAYPNIKYVFCNGETSEKHFRRHVLPEIKREIYFLRLPSTSPANASVPPEEKMRMWRYIRHTLENRVKYKSVAKTEIGEIIVLADDRVVTGVFLPGSEPETDGFALFSGNRISELAKNQIEEYFKGKIRSFDIPFEIRGTNFEKNVYNALLKVPYGCTVTYRELAEMAGNKHAARAVGQALKKNPLPLIIPCHRVIGSKGRYVGFMGIGGNPLQKMLIELEAEYSGKYSFAESAD
ncbi:DNA-deoxyinosine glycosylase [Thermoclostridium stercorarium subsp. thermolacticum DSM 2910]|jgi:hypoxanthine-DNA glycosylase|uniref:methylated-DNA--[protein]-cysteine S-methyltransferase n=3 Tax=Thermoclostridium stercorarium TaxID=1510 RepID=A0A1B1YN21_THEST|nr:DNA-deoxyinosine glycosylase [Thermoclostridium stercorarium subsp. thermolacticum DSM 2910]ANX02169.1 DNA-deoxyinosine glycosylase [Thermoclostridium stercorarium subsp. leptospartum DSM 9219]